MKTSSAKAKGRRLQNWVKDTLIEYFGWPDDDSLVRTAIMGERGADVKLHHSLLNEFPYSIECKNAEKYKFANEFNLGALHGKIKSNFIIFHSLNPIMHTYIC